MNAAKIFLKPYYIILFFTALLTACGGGNTPPSNISPTANAGNNQTVDEQTTFILSGSGTDSDGSISSYQWSQTGGSSVIIDNADNPTASFITPATEIELVLTFQMKVTDDDNATGNDSVIITIEPANEVPIVDAGIDQNAYEGSIVELSGTATDTDGTIESYQWSQISGEVVTISNDNNNTSNFTVPKVFNNTILVFELLATDNEGATNIDNIEIAVKKNGQLNDTGLTECLDEDMALTSCPSSYYIGQDAEFGRDALAKSNELVKVGTGDAGFDFTKLDANGEPLDESATEWSCVKDNLTGLIWEVKTNDLGLQDKNNIYSYYNPYNKWTNGTRDAGKCSEIECDTNSYMDAINSLALCGGTNWKLPSISQIVSIANYNYSAPPIDPKFFPNTKNRAYWSSSFGGNANTVGTFSFFDGYVNPDQTVDICNTCISNVYIRLVLVDSEEGGMQ